MHEAFLYVNTKIEHLSAANDMVDINKTNLDEGKERYTHQIKSTVLEGLLHQ